MTRYFTEFLCLAIMEADIGAGSKVSPIATVKVSACHLFQKSCFKKRSSQLEGMQHKQTQCG